jgi:cell division protein ZipA
MGFRMDFSLRDWLFILGPVFIIGVLAHGYWRMRVNRSSIKMSLDKSFLNSRHHSRDGAEEAEKLQAELPNGGARVVSEPKQASLNLDDDVPVLMESVSALDESLNSNTAADGVGPITQAPAMPVATKPVATRPVATRPITIKSITKKPDPIDQAISAEPAESLPEIESTPEIDTAPEPAAPLRAIVDCPEKYLVLYVIAKNKDFRGDTLRSCLKKQQMRFGEMSIFHRLNADNRSEFSLVNAIKPGTFDLDTMSSLTTPALSLFMRAHELANPIGTYHEMLAVAEALAKALNGEVRDENRQPLNRQTMEHYQADLQIFVDTYFR